MRASSDTRLIVDHVLARGDATVAELAELTGVSLMTVHRDIAELADRGILRKYHGGVSAQPSMVFESSSDFRLHAHTDEKQALARAALSFVGPGMSVMLDDSTIGAGPGPAAARGGAADRGDQLPA